MQNCAREPPVSILYLSRSIFCSFLVCRIGAQLKKLPVLYFLYLAKKKTSAFKIYPQTTKTQARQHCRLSGHGPLLLWYCQTRVSSKGILRRIFKVKAAHFSMHCNALWKKFQGLAPQQEISLNGWSGGNLSFSGIDKCPVRARQTENLNSTQTEKCRHWWNGNGWLRKLQAPTL